MNLLRRLFDHEYKEMKKFTVLADKVMALDEEYSKLTDTELQNKTEEFKNRLRDGEKIKIFKNMMDINIMKNINLVEKLLDMMERRNSVRSRYMSGFM